MADYDPNFVAAYFDHGGLYRYGYQPAAVAEGARGVNRGALSLGLNYGWDLNTLFKLEYRLDWASEPVFVDTRSLRAHDRNQVLGTAVVVSF